MIWSVYLFAFLSIYILVLSKSGVSFRNAGQSTKEIFKYYRTYGVHMYSGTLFFAGAMTLSSIMISYFSENNAGVGFYTLSLAISRPLALIPGVIAITWFRDFSRLKSIPARMITATSLMTVITLLMLFILTKPFVSFFYGENFLPLIPLTYISGIGMALHGMAGFFSRYLEAGGSGRAVRNISIITGVTILVLNFLLIPGMAETGAAVTLVLSGIVYIAGMLFYYLRLTGKKKIYTFGRNK